MPTKPPLMLEDFVAEESGETGSEAWREWRRQKQELDEEILSLRRESEDLRSERAALVRSIENLRTMLAPLHRALRAIFGEIELAAGETAAAPMYTVEGTMSRTGSATDPRWQSFKASFPGVGAEIIDALLIHGEMKLTNLSKLLKRHYDTVRKAATSLKQAGAITQTGGSINLKR